MFLYCYAVNQKETQKRLSSYHSSPNSQLLTPNSKLSTLNSIILSPSYASALQLFLQGEHQGQFQSSISVETHA